MLLRTLSRDALNKESHKATAGAMLDYALNERRGKPSDLFLKEHQEAIKSIIINSDRDVVSEGAIKKLTRFNNGYQERASNPKDQRETDDTLSEQPFFAYGGLGGVKNTHGSDISRVTLYNLCPGLLKV